MLPLSLVPVGCRSRVLRLSGKEELKLRLAELGLNQGQELTVISSVDGNLIVAVRGCKLALDAKTSHHIQVECMGECP